MSTPEESLNDQDPDYASAVPNNQAQQKIYEENARNITAKKITAIVEKEFSREIELKEKEILKIQETLHKSLKVFHLLRYVIVTDFYNRKQCQLSEAAETSKQTRIHPAVKSLLGKSPKFYQEPAVPSTSTDPRFLPIDESLKSDTKSPTTTAELEVEDDTNKNNGKSAAKRKMLEEDSRPRKLPRYVPPKSNTAENTVCPSRGERYKVCKRIVVGNISKWIPPDWREDNASHKWTMYVRGDKDNADISSFVSKVRFFLHPSYHPNDVVEVTAYPFHLSRRGWGEFPLRVQLHFKNSLDKPIDIIHHLKLDRTYTGLQMLGSETLVDLWIHPTESDRNQNGNEVNEAFANTCGKIEQSDNSGLETIRERSTKYTEVSEHFASRLIANVFEEIQVKKEGTDTKICEQFKSSMDWACTEEGTDVKIKDERSGATFDNFSVTLGESSSLQIIRSHVDHDHDYSNKEYPNFYRRIVREGNVTIEHFLDKKCSPVTNISTTGNDEEKPEDASLKSHVCNGDIQSSNDSQPPTALSVRDTTEDFLRTPQVSSECAIEKSNNRKSLLLSNVNKLLQDSGSSNASTKDTPATVNGFCKPSNSSLDRLRNLQKVASMSNNSHLKPLEISIPPLFGSSVSKRILLMKDKKLIPVDVTRRLSDSEVKVSITNDKSNVGIPHGVSILKKPTSTYKVNTRSGKEAAVLTLKSSNSLLLNANYDVPALKIADSHDLQYNHHLPEVMKNTSSVVKLEEVCMKSEDKDEKTIQRVKITLGKDKYRIQSKRQLYETVLQSIENANITDTETFVRFIIRRLPIVTRDAQDAEYRQLHPYARSCEKDFFAQNIGKQRALEWCRAKMIRGFLQKRQFDDEQLWSTKEILIWARLHGYMPNHNVSGVPEVDTKDATKRLTDSSASTAVVSTCTEPVAFRAWLQNCRQESSHRSDGCNEVEDEEIDVEFVDSSCGSTIARSSNENGISTVNSALIPLELEENLMPLHKFVCDTAQDIGIKIGPEEIVPGVVYCSAGRALTRVIECFVEDLTRSSLANAWERNKGNGCPKIITLDDVRNALVSREEFDIFTNEGLGSSQQLDATS